MRVKTGMKDLALALCKAEGGKKQVDIAQAEDFLHKLCRQIEADPVRTILALMAGSGMKKIQATICPAKKKRAKR